MEPIEEKASMLLSPHQQQSSNIRPIPFAVLKLQFKKLVDAQGGVLFTKDLLKLIDQYEDSQKVLLLTPEQKKVILPYTLSNPDLEMTADDILQLLKLLFPPSPIASISCPSSDLQVRPRTSPPLTTQWKRRASTAASLSMEERNLITEEIKNSDIYIKEVKQEDHYEEEQQQPQQQQEEQEEQEHKEQEQQQQITIKEQIKPPVEEEYSEKDLAGYYRRSLKLTQRLKSSERSLASLARDNEDKIVQLQNKVDDMNNEVIKQRREIQEYKSKEKNSLEQISTLETHIQSVQQSETDQKQVYRSIKRLFDDKCDETQKLQELLRDKESDLENTEELLKNLQSEVQLLGHERKRLMGLQENLEQELEQSASAHNQLAEQKSENEKLKEIIDSLKLDLDEALHQGEVMVMEPSKSAKTLDSELDNDEFTQERLKTVQDEKDYYKNRATEAKEDLDRVKNELDYLRRALDTENRSLVNELAELRSKTSIKTFDNIIMNNTSILPTLNLPAVNLPAVDIPVDLNPTTILPIDTTSVEMNIPPPAVNDFWSHNRMRQRHKSSRKKRAVMDLHESSSSKLTLPISYTNRNTMSRRDDKIVTNTITFALYTVLIYFFGIVTSTFLMEGSGTPPGWEHALAAAASGQVPKSKLLEIILYWLEKLLIEPQGLPVS